MDNPNVAGGMLDNALENHVHVNEELREDIEIKVPKLQL